MKTEEEMKEILENKKIEEKTKSQLDGVFIRVHKISELNISELLTYPFNGVSYYNLFTYREELDLREYFGTGQPESPDSYKILPKNDKGDKERLEKKIAEKLDSLQNGKKLFFIESNSAHHVSYFLAKNYLTDGADTSITINFDQHSDTGSNTSKDFFCSTWGGDRLKEDNVSQYLVVCAQNRSNYAVSSKNDFLTKLKNYSKIYVTVDMDVLTKGYKDPNIKRTNWGHGNLTIDQLKELLNALPDNKIVAADITGFPPYVPESNEKKFKRGITLKNDVSGTNSEDQLNAFAKDIETVADILSKKIIL